MIINIKDIRVNKFFQNLRYPLTIFFMLISFSKSPAQFGEIPIIDTVDVNNSDSAIYNRIQQVISKKKFTQKIFSLLTRQPSVEVAHIKNAIDEQFAPFKGQIIEDIKINVLSPFGYDVKNDTIERITTLQKTGNNYHANTKNVIIRNNLLFKKNQSIDPIIMAETESVLRNLDYINDVVIKVDSIGEGRAVVTVTVKDNWSIGFYPREISYLTDIEIFDNNMFGLGNELGFRGIFNTRLERKFGFGLGYKYSNLINSFVNLNASYVDNILYRNHFYAVERPLQKGLNIFGQMSYRQTETNLNYAVWDSISPTYDKEFSISSGYAFLPTAKNNTFVVSSRFFSRSPMYKNVEKPNDPQNYQHVDNRMILLQLSLFRQRYFRDYMINSFGKPENYAYGYNISTQIGYSQWKPLNRRGLYTSLKTSFNNRLNIGSLYCESVLSWFSNQKQMFEGVLKLKASMFSQLYTIGDQNYRFFFNINYAKRLYFIPGFRNYYLTFNDVASMDLRKFEKNAFASERLMLQSEIDMFSSLNILGFKFVFYPFCDFGWMSAYQQRLVRKDNIFWGGGFGVRVRNDLLVLRTLELKIGVYPKFNQSKIENFINISSSIPNKSPNFTPKYPEEIPL